MVFHALLQSIRVYRTENGDGEIGKSRFFIACCIVSEFDGPGPG